jgi:intracellular sulfur oxidation DsrE/DsrF family protein
MNWNRRSFLATGAAALGTLAASSPAATAQLVTQQSDWKMAEFGALLKSTARAKQVFDVHAVGDGKFLGSMKNSLNGLHYGFGIPQDSIKLAAGLHGAANLFNFSDEMWEKYPLGAFAQVNDPKTSKPATRNIYLHKTGNTSTDLTDRNSIYQNFTIEALQARGVKFLSCHNATSEAVRAMVAQSSLKTPPDEIVQDLQAHLIPGALIVPAMVAAISLLQSDGHFTYIAG